MDGLGKFIHREGREFDGMYKNNYFYYGGSVAVNPFMKLSEIDQFTVNQQEIQKSKENRKKIEKQKVEFAKSTSHLVQLIDASY